MLHRLSVAAVATIVLAGSVAVAQVRSNPLVFLTLNTGTVLVAEVKQETSQEISVLNLDSHEVETYPKAKTYVRRTATEAKLLGAKVAVPGKRPDRLEALLVREMTGTPPELFDRLGKYPENAAAYLAWALEREVPRKDEGRPAYLAVLPFRETEHSVTPETTRRSEELTNALGRRKVPLVERAQLDKVLTELNLENNGAFDPATAQKIGKQLGAPAVLLGTLVPRGGLSDLNLRLVETETGRILDTPTLIGLRRGGASASGKQATPVLTGTWVTTGADGRTFVFTAAGNGLCSNSIGGTGTWRQSRFKIVINFRGAAAPGKPPPPYTRWEGEITPDGETFHITNNKGDVLSASRR